VPANLKSLITSHLKCLWSIKSTFINKSFFRIKNQTPLPKTKLSINLKDKIEEYPMDIATLLKDKSILITGGTGSFGRAFAKWLIQGGLPRRVIIFSRDEWKQWEMKNSSPIFSDSRMRYFLGDVRDKERLCRAFHEVDVVIHAAALKQVPAAEYNPTEFIKTNVLGAVNIIDAAIECGVKKVLALSTDKAVNPINMYGATKLCSDKLFVAGNSYVGTRKYPTFSVVRYGNVAGTRGSVIPLWLKLIRENSRSLPITDERMTRFWISLQETAEFVASCLINTQGGEIFVPKIPSFHVTDLAKIMSPGSELQTIGIREGEKLHELMIGVDDARHTLEFKDHFIILPEMYTPTKELMDQFLNGRKGKKLPDGFSFTSENNEKWLEKEELQKRLDKVLRDENL
jgi:UDP-N-acetylglucosamine 4,6-dehydratase/5-epimerase